MKTPSLAELIDQLYVKRQRRIADQKAVDALKAEEDAMSAQILEALRGMNAWGHSGSVGQVTRSVKSKPDTDNADWPAVYAHIQATGEFDLLHKRLSDTACRARWEQGDEIPGIPRVDEESLSIKKA